MIDYRCPACNRPVEGREDVAYHSQLPGVTACPHCGTPVVIKEYDEGKLGKVWSFSIAPAA
jgi:DNA-directed RNA polymerase subunit RPC12/RpoP